MSSGAISRGTACCVVQCQRIWPTVDDWECRAPTHDAVVPEYYRQYPDG